MTTTAEQLRAQIEKMGGMWLRVRAAEALTGAVNARKKADGIETAEAMRRIIAQLAGTLEDPDFEATFGKGGKYEGV